MSFLNVKINLLFYIISIYGLSLCCSFHCKEHHDDEYEITPKKD